MFNKKRKNNKGFTLVELLVVIAIIGVLAVVAVPSLMKNMNRAKATDVISYISASRTAAMSEYAATQTVGEYTDIKGTNGAADGALVGLVEDKPSEVESVSVTIANSNATGGNDTNITISVVLNQASGKLEDEVRKQANASFGTGKVTVSTETGTK